LSFFKRKNDTLTALNDQALLDRMRNARQAEACLHVLVDRYKEKLYYHIHRIVLNHDDADDALQNTFLRLWEKQAGFRQESSLFTWLYRVATNEALGILRKRKPQIDIETIDTSALNQHSMGIEYSSDDISALLEAAVNTLPEKQRMVFNLRFYDEMPYTEMSEVLDTSEGALKASYHIAVKKIDAFLRNKTI
jgi:RNA polymerase sigma factor (sigma-70 family)